MTQEILELKKEITSLKSELTSLKTTVSVLNGVINTNKNYADSKITELERKLTTQI